MPPAACLWPALSLLHPPRPDSRWRWLQIVYDDLRPQLSAFGHEGMKTPHFDSLAAESLTFTQAYTNYPYCARKSQADCRCLLVICRPFCQVLLITQAVCGSL